LSLNVLGLYNSSMMKSTKILFAVALAAVSLSSVGCVERKLTIGSDPSGALVTLNDVEIGRTPVTVPFTWYGDYDIVLRHEKNVSTPENPVMRHYFLHTHQRINAAPSQWIGIDLLSELVPWTVTDEKFLAFTIPPVSQPTDAELLQRAAALKARLGGPGAAAEEPQRTK